VFLTNHNALKYSNRAIVFRKSFFFSQAATPQDSNKHVGEETTVSNESEAWLTSTFQQTMQGATAKSKTPDTVSSTPEFVSTTIKKHETSDDKSKCLSKLKKEITHLRRDIPAVAYAVNYVQNQVLIKRFLKVF